MTTLQPGDRVRLQPRVRGDIFDLALAGPRGQHQIMLSSPIIVYDYPEIADESPGDLYDSTEIDEILSLRILTLSDDEQREIGIQPRRGCQSEGREQTVKHGPVPHDPL